MRKGIETERLLIGVRDKGSRMAVNNTGFFLAAVC